MLYRHMQNDNNKIRIIRVKRWILRRLWLHKKQWPALSRRQTSAALGGLRSSGHYWRKEGCFVLFLKYCGPHNRELWICSDFRETLRVPKPGYGLSAWGDTEICSNRYRGALKRQGLYKEDLEEETKVCGVSTRVILCKEKDVDWLPHVLACTLSSSSLYEG